MSPVQEAAENVLLLLMQSEVLYDIGTSHLQLSTDIENSPAIPTIKQMFIAYNLYLTRSL